MHGYSQIMRVLHVTHSASGGGAAIAARRIFEATCTQPGIDAHLISTSPLAEGLTNPRITYFKPRNERVNAQVESFALRLQKSMNPAHRTIGLHASGLAHRILECNWDLVHLHWVGLGTLGINEIGLLATEVPMLWTLHDSWPFCGAEHHPHFENDDRFATGYSLETRLRGDARFDLDAAVFRAKRRHWVSPITLVAPSQFMADNARASILAKTWPVTTIPHPIDESVFQSISGHDREALMRQERLDPLRPMVLFVSSPGSDFNKGLDLLDSVFSEIHRLSPQVQLVTLGGPWPQLGSDVAQLPATSSERSLAKWLAAADVVLVTSRLESFSLVAAEAQVCGTPVVAFRTSGLIDVLSQQPTSTLVPQWDTTEMAHQVLQIALRPSNHGAGADIAKVWNPVKIGRQYVEAYEETRGTHGTFTSGNP